MEHANHLFLLKDEHGGAIVGAVATHLGWPPTIAWSKERSPAPLASERSAQEVRLGCAVNPMHHEHQEEQP